MPWFPNSSCYPRQQAAAKQSKIWMVHNCVATFCFALDARSVGGSFRRGQITIGCRGLGPKDREKGTRRALLYMDTYS